MTPVSGKDGNDSLALEQMGLGQLRRPGAFQLLLGSHRQAQQGRLSASLTESPLWNRGTLPSSGRGEMCPERDERSNQRQRQPVNAGLTEPRTDQWHAEGPGRARLRSGTRPAREQQNLCLNEKFKQPFSPLLIQLICSECLLCANLYSVLGT